MTGAWYATRDRVPPYGMIVWARCGDNGQSFKAARLLSRRHRCAVWGRQRPRGGVQFMRYPPDWWAGIDGPAEPDRPMPEPPAFAKFAEPRKTRPSDTIEGRAWWRDGCNLTYSPKGSVTPREAEGRVLRALLTCSATKLESPRGPSSNSAWIARQVERVEREMGNRPAYWHARFQPTPRDVSDCATVLDWISGIGLLDENYYTALAMRAVNPPYSFREIGETIGRSEAAARRIYKRAIDFVTRRANGKA